MLAGEKASKKNGNETEWEVGISVSADLTHKLHINKVCRKMFRSLTPPAMCSKEQKRP